MVVVCMHVCVYVCKHGSSTCVCDSSMERFEALMVICMYVCMCASMAVVHVYVSFFG